MEKKRNLWVIQTDKPSRLFLNKVNNKLLLEDISNPSLKKVLPSGSYQNIYITSDELIKEGDAFLHPDNTIERASRDLDGRGLKKIILTTEPILIQSGVQEISNDFLEWFVKNPSCERVGVELFPKFSNNLYGIILPKEEPKPHSFCETPEEKCTMNYCDENGCQNRKRELAEPQEEQKV